jgi:S-adenosylmethionine-diacylgycerolhomoserine-N-methlytransferase
MPPPEGAAPQWDASPLRKFYRFHAPIYDWTRPFILFERRRIVKLLEVSPGERVLDVGCGTGWNFDPLLAAGADLIGIECSPDMLAKAEARARGLRKGVVLDPSPYGSHAGHRASADCVLFSYSLSMIPSFETALRRAREDLRQGGRIGVVDFLDATNPGTKLWLETSHVHLGNERLTLLKRLFPSHQVRVRSALLWRYFLFVGARPDDGGGADAQEPLLS